MSNLKIILIACKGRVFNTLSSYFMICENFSYISCYLMRSANCDNYISRINETGKNISTSYKLKWGILNCDSENNISIFFFEIFL
jgi:hypothetical protein